MHSLADAILPVLPRLRRYGAAVTGSRRAGDQYIEICLETLIQEPGRITPAADIAPQLFDLLHDAVDACGVEAEAPSDPNLESLQRAVLGLKLRDRRLVLLRLLEGFSLAETATLLDMSEVEAESRLKEICTEFKDMCAARVQVIENERKIPADLADIVAHTDHRLIGIAADSHDATTLA